MKFSRTFCVLLAGWGVLAIPYLAPQFGFFPSHDAQVPYQIFHSTYSQFFHHGTFALWRPGDTYGLTNDIYLLISLAPAQYLAMIAGKAFGITNALRLFTLSVMLEQLVLVTGCYLLCRRLRLSDAAVVLVTLGLLASSYWGHQLWWNFRFFYALPLVLATALGFAGTGDVKYLVRAAIVGVIFAFGTLTYFVTVQALVVAVFLTCTVMTRRGFRLHWRPSAAFYVTLGLALGLGLLFADFAGHAAGGLVSQTDWRDPATHDVTLASFLSYASGIGLSNLRELFGLPPNTSGYQAFVGLIPLALAMFAVIATRGWARILPALATAAVILLLSLSFEAFVAPALYVLWPLMKDIRHLGYFKVEAKLFVLLLAGIGLTLLAEKGGRAPKRTMFLVSTGAVLAVAGAVAALETVHRVYLHHYFSASFPLAYEWLSIGLLAFAGVLAFRMSRPRQAVAGLVTLYLVEIASYAFVLHLFLPIEARVVNEGDWQDVVFDDLLHRVARVQANPDTVYVHPAAFAPTRTKFLPRFEDDYQLLNDRYPIRGTTLSVDECAFPGRVDWVASGVSALIRERTGSPDYSGDDLLWEPALLAELGCETPKLFIERAAGPPARSAPADSIRVVAFDANRLTVDVALDPARPDGWLVYRDAYHPGWTASVNGRATPVEVADLAFKKVRVRDARARVSFVFTGNHWSRFSVPIICVIGAIASLLVIALAVQCAVASWPRRGPLRWLTPPDQPAG